MTSLLKTLVLGGALAAATITTARAGGVVYVSDGPSNQPWGVNDFTNAFNTDFGAGNWTSDTFADGTSMFNSSNSFIMIEGGDGNSTDFDNYFNTPGVVTAAEAWVAAGGSIFINGGRWTYDALDVGFGVTMLQPEYADASFTGTAAGPSPIFTPATGTSWGGNYFNHDVVTGAGLSALILTSSNLDSLAEENYGLGHVIVGGLTAPTFWSPQPQGTVLLDNILLYGDDQLAASTPDSTSTITLTLLGAGLVCVTALRRRRLPIWAARN